MRAGGEPSHATFEERVLAVIRSLGPGDLMTYGEIAVEAGSPGAARAVGNVMAHCPDDVPWWRVVTSTGRLVPGHEALQAGRLAAEGIDIDLHARRARRPVAPGRARR